MSNEDDVSDELEVHEIPDVADLVDDDDIDLGSGQNSMVYELKFSRENIQFFVDGAMVKRVPKTSLRAPYKLSDPAVCMNMASLFRRAGLEAVLREYTVAE